MPHKSIFRQLDGPVLVSACLLGIACRYDGQSKSKKEIFNRLNVIPIPICPEQSGGLPTPRSKAYFVGGDGFCVIKNKAIVIDSNGEDITEKFIIGARNVCMIADLLQVKWAILKDKSPSCGTHKVWIDNELKEGLGVCAAMLKDAGVTVMNEEGKI